MAGKFPLAFSDASDYGATNANENQYFYLHNVSNTSVFADEKTPVDFDVYTFAQSPGDSDTPHDTFALIIIKNVGASQSHLKVTNIELTDGDLDPDSNPFSFVTSTAGIDTEIQSNFSIVDSSTFSGLQSGSNNEAPNGSGFGPWGYLKVNETIANPGNSIEAEVDADGNQASTDFAAAGAGVRYIPLYNPENGSDEPGLINHGNDDRRIGAKSINGVTYPEYGAFLIRCNPTGELDGTAKLKIHFSVPSGVIQVFDLPIVAYRRGDLIYEQGRWNASTGTFITAATYGDKCDTNKTPETEQIAYQTVGNGSFNQNFPLQNTNTASNEIMPEFSNSHGFKENIIIPMLPAGTLSSVKGHLPSEVDGVNNDEIYVRASDSTTFTGGIRFLKPNVVELKKSIQSNTTKHMFTSAPTGSSGFELKYFTQPGFTDTPSAEIDTTTRKLDTDEKIFAKIRIPDKHNALFYSTSKNAFASSMHPNETGQFTDDEGNADTNFNRKVKLYALPFFHNPFFINEESADAQDNGEVTDKDTLYVAHGDYRVWSTNGLIGSMLCRIESIENLTTSVVSTAFSSLGAANDRFGDACITENVEGLIQHPINSSYYKEQEMSSNENQASSGAISNTANQKITQFKHKHIFDLFVLPKELGSVNKTLGNIEVQFNNISGYDAFYASQFNFTEDTINNTVQVFTSDLETEEVLSDRIPVELVQENQFTDESGNITVNFKPGGIKTIGNTNTVDAANISSIFSKDMNTTIAWTNLNDGDDLYPDGGIGSKVKKVNLQIKYQPESISEFYNTPKFDGINDLAPTDYTNVFFDALGRIKHSGSLSLRQSIVDIAAGTGGVTKKFLGSQMYDTLPLKFHFYGKAFLPKWSGFNPADPEFGFASAWVTVGKLYMTNYGGEDLFGESSISGSGQSGERAEYTSTHKNAAIQGISATEVSGANSVHGMTDGVKGIQFQYARGASHPTDNYFYRKYPLNGPCSYKYEDYLNSHSLGLNETRIIGSTTYGILPGPLAEGRFSNGTPRHHAAPINTTILDATADTLNTANGRYEVVIPFNFTNENHQHAHIVDISLENHVGQYTDSSTGGITYGDPRAILGGDLTIAADGTIGNKYEVPLSTQKGQYSHVAPVPIVQGALSSDYLVEVEFTGTTTTATTPTGGTAGMVSGMQVFQKDGGDDKIPAGTTITVVNETTLNFNQSLNAAANGATFDVYLDWPMNDYVCWDLVEKTGVSGDGVDQFQRFDFGGGFKQKVLTFGEHTGSGATNSFDLYHPDQKIVDQSFISADSSGALNYKNKGKMNSRKLGSTEDVISDGSFYGNLSEQGANIPLIYFAVNNQINLTDNPSANTNNELDEGIFFNRLRIRYIIHEKLEKYGRNQSKITGTSIDASEVIQQQNQSVFEDTYLIKCQYVNKTAEAIVSDLEGNVVAHTGVIDFGTLQSE